MEVKIKLNGGIMPTKGSKYAAAYDLYVPEDYVVNPGRQLIDMKFAIELPVGWKANIRPRSGFSLRGIEAVLSEYKRKSNGEIWKYTSQCYLDADVLLGLVDCDYRGNVGVILYVSDNFKNTDSQYSEVVIKKGTRIAQMEICKSEETELIEVEELDLTNNRGGGFGHTGA